MGSADNLEQLRSPKMTTKKGLERAKLLLTIFSHHPAMQD